MHTPAYSWPSGALQSFHVAPLCCSTMLLTLLAPCVHFPVEGLPSDAEEETSGAPPLLLQCCFIAAAADSAAGSAAYEYIYICKSP